MVSYLYDYLRSTDWIIPRIVSPFKPFNSGKMTIHTPIITTPTVAQYTLYDVP